MFFFSLSSVTETSVSWTDKTIVDGQKIAMRPPMRGVFVRIGNTYVVIESACLNGRTIAVLPCQEILSYRSEETGAHL